MSHHVEVCHDAVLSWDQQLVASVKAIEETVGNAEVNPRLLLDAVRGGYDIEPMAAVLLRDKKWAANRVIKIGFLDGSDKLRSMVKAQANTWLNYIGLDFQWVDASLAEIRITFTRGGSWSYLGTDNLAIASGKPTMQFGWLTETSSADEVRRVTVHEFGHMLALGHEQAHPTGAIPWNKPVVYEYYRKTNGWSQAQVDSQVFYVYSTGQTNYSAYDKFSIMHYSIPAEHLTDPSRAVPWNTMLSATDIQFMGQQYPKSVVTPPTANPVWKDRNQWWEGRGDGTFIKYPASNPSGTGAYRTYGWLENKAVDSEDLRKH